MARSFFFIPAFFLIIVLSSCSRSDTYEVYALKFKDVGMQPAKGSVAEATDTDSINVCYMIWFLKGNNGRNILVDAGDPDSTEAGSFNFVKPEVLLGDIEIKASDITDIIITHPHHDHVGGIMQFPYGKVWMQRKDYEYFTVDAWQDSNFNLGFDKNDVRNLMDISSKGRMTLIDGDSIEIIPGIRVFTGSMHTKENQYLLINSDSGKKIILASDAIWFYNNLDKMVPIDTYIMDPVSYVKAMKRMKSLASDEKYIIPGHDGGVFSRFRKINSRVVKIE